MSQDILYGKPVAGAILSEVLQHTTMKNRVCIALLRVGDNPDDISYQDAIIKRAKDVQIEIRPVLLPENIVTQQVIDAIMKINADIDINGCLIFRPLPKHLDDNAVRAALCSEKDIDGVTDGSLAGVYSGSGRGFAPCTATACLEILHHYNIEISGKNAVIIGRSIVVGKPVAMLLLSENATVTICHSRTSKVQMLNAVRSADIVIAAAGSAGLINGDMLRSGQIIIDAGINLDKDGKQTGDVDFAVAQQIVSAVTPVPGGVGSVTTALLLRNAVIAAKKVRDFR